MEQIKVSIIITTYKRVDAIKKAILSVCMQTLKEIEIIVVDDNNPDSEERKATKAIVENLQGSDSRIKYICHLRNMNGAVARNTGIKTCSGKYVAFLDNDDEYAAEKIEKEFYALENAGIDIGGVICDCIVKQSGRLDSYLRVFESGNYLVETLACTFQMGSGSNLFLRKSVIDDVGLFDDRFRRHQDYEFLVRFFTKYNLIRLPEGLLYIGYSNTHSNIPNYKLLEETKRLYLEKYFDIVNSLPEKERDFVIRSNQYQLLCYSINEKNYIKTRKLLSEVKMIHKLSLSEKKQLLRIYILTTNFGIFIKQYLYKRRK